MRTSYSARDVVPTDRQFPMIIEHKGCTVTIVETPNRGRPAYTACYYIRGDRQRFIKRDFPALFKQAQAIALEQGEGSTDVLALSGRERRAYEHALDLLAPYGLSVDSAIIQFAEAMRILNGLTTLREAAEFTRSHRPKVTSTVTVREVVDEFVRTKESEGLTKLYTRDLRTRLARFVGFFQGPISAVTTPDIAKFLAAVGGKKRTRRNFVTTLGTLFNFSKMMGYLPDDHPGISRVPKPRKDPADIGVLTPQEMSSLLHTSQSDLIPALVVGAFAGLRSEEIKRLNWGCIKLDQGFIEVPARYAKMAVRRLIPITESLNAWLRAYERKDGPVVRYVNFANQLLKLAKRANIKWRRNALRHSFISYRVAVVKNVPQVALEAGNSVSVIQSNYLRVVTEELGKQWFSIVPPTASNVVRLPTPVAPTESPGRVQTGTE